MEYHHFTQDVRSGVLSRPLELGLIEEAIKESIERVASQMNGMKVALEGLLSDETNLQSKIEKKRMELDRAEKRLKSLQTVR